MAKDVSSDEQCLLLMEQQTGYGGLGFVSRRELQSVAPMWAFTQQEVFFRVASLSVQYYG